MVQQLSEVINRSSYVPNARTNCNLLPTEGLVLMLFDIQRLIQQFCGISLLWSYNLSSKEQVFFFFSISAHLNKDNLENASYKQSNCYNKGSTTLQLRNFTNEEKQVSGCKSFQPKSRSITQLKSTNTQAKKQKPLEPISTPD